MNFRAADHGAFDVRSTRRKRRRSGHRKTSEMCKQRPSPVTPSAKTQRRRLCPSLGLRHGRRASRKVAVGIIGSSVCHKFSNKIAFIGSQKPLRIPGNRVPSADWYPSGNKWGAMNPRLGNQYALRYYRNALARGCQRNERLRSGTFEGNVRSDTRRLTG
jgi:hypothetical protein